MIRRFFRRLYRRMTNQHTVYVSVNGRTVSGPKAGKVAAEIEAGFADMSASMDRMWGRIERAARDT